MKELLRVKIVVIMVLFSTLGNSQDMVMSQYYMIPSTINPAFAGQNSGPNFGLMYRNQWPAFADGVYESYLFNYDQFFDGINSGFGVQLSSDDQGAGILTTNSVDINYAYRLETNSGWTMNLGMNVGLDYRRLNWNNLVFYDQLDPEFGAILPGGITIPSEETRPENLNRTSLDVGAGLNVYNEMFFVGLSLQHLNRPSVDFLRINENTYSGIPMRYTLMAGAQIDLDKGARSTDVFVTPMVMASMQGGSGQINLGTYLGIRSFNAGLFYRHALSNPDALIASVGFSYNYFKIGYSYDYTVSKLSTNTGGTHEIGMTINIIRKKPKYMDCFNFMR